jgi:hypothetical protein
MKLNQIVYDSWWPWRLGKIVKVLKTRIHVMWIDNGRVDSYDKPHQQFLKVYKYPKP